MSHQKWLLQTPEKEPTSTKNNHPQNHQNNKKKTYIGTLQNLRES